MDTVNLKQFRNNLELLTEQVVDNHAPLKVTSRSGDTFVVISADDWEREQETVYVLQNSSLMKQIVESLATYTKVQD